MRFLEGVPWLTSEGRTPACSVLHLISSATFDKFFKKLCYETKGIENVLSWAHRM